MIRYFLETTTSGFAQACTHFNIRMSCSGGGETASPAESDPLGFVVDANTGAISGTPQRVRDGYKMRLRAVDAANVRTDVAEWTFNVIDPPKLAVNPSSGWSVETDGQLASKYHVAETHLLPKPRVKKEELLLHPAGGNYDQVRTDDHRPPNPLTPRTMGRKVIFRRACGPRARAARRNDLAAAVMNAPSLTYHFCFALPG